MTERFRDEFEFGFGTRVGVGAGGFVRWFGDGHGGGDRDDFNCADNWGFGIGVEEIVGSEPGGEAAGGAQAACCGGRERRV